MRDRYAPLFAALRESVFGAPGRLDRATRHAAAFGGPLPPDLSALAAKVRDEAHAIDDEDVERLRRAGHVDDAIFELIVAAAFGAAQVRLSRALAALGDRS